MSEWFKKHKWLTAIIGILIIGVFANATSSVEPATSDDQSATVYKTVENTQESANLSNNNYYKNSVGNTAPSPAYTSVKPATNDSQPAAVYKTVENTQESANLSNNNYYENSVGNTVHSPAYTNDNSVPAGASAQCRDGTYSFSQSRRGTCSHHGGVARWL